MNDFATSNACATASIIWDYDTLRIWNYHCKEEKAEYWPACSIREEYDDALKYDDTNNDLNIKKDLNKLFPSECLPFSSKMSESLLTPFEYEPRFSYWSNDSDTHKDNIVRNNELEGLKFVPYLQDDTSGTDSDDDSVVYSSDDDDEVLSSQDCRSKTRLFDPVIAPPKSYRCKRN